MEENKDPKILEDQLTEDEAFKAIPNQSVIDNTGTDKNEYYDVLTTEDALMAIYKNNT
jgi:hypothetical protein